MRLVGLLQRLSPPPRVGTPGVMSYNLIINPFLTSVNPSGVKYQARNQKRVQVDLG